MFTPIARGCALLILGLAVSPRIALATNPFALEGGQPVQILGTTLTGPDCIANEQASHYYIGATIGENWSSLPARLHVNYFTSGTYKAALDISGDVYLTGPTYFGRLRDQAWFYPGADYLFASFISDGCCYYIDCPDTGQWQHQWVGIGGNGNCQYGCPSPGAQVEQYENLDTNEFVSTGTGGKLENGVLRLLDGHGGTNAVHIFELETIVGSGENHSHYHLYFAYVPPGIYRDTDTGLQVSKFPSDTLRIDLRDRNVPIYPLAKVVAHVSCDVAPASPGEVDAGDLAALATTIGNCASYCTNSGCQPDGSPAYCTWHTDFNSDGSIDASDIAVLAIELDIPEPTPCGGITKARNAVDTRSNILAWFGMRQTGHTVVQCGFETPEIEIVDEGQMRRAVADPYGYRTHIAAGQSRSWSRVKGLYR